jgi:hypothetical protein
MSKPPVHYKKLPGRGSQLTGYSSLYQGPDHLLLVHSTGYSERYQRFYFRDIQAFYVRRTDLWYYVTGILLVFGLLLLALGISVGDVGGVILDVFGGLLALGGVLYAAGGPSCACHVQTAVQTERVPSLNRLRRTRKVLAQIRPLIDEAQRAVAGPAAAPLEEAAPAATPVETPPDTSAPPAA